MHQLTAQSAIPTVTNFNDLVTTPLKGSANVVCWERECIGDFNEIIQQCVSAENITVIEPELLRNIKLSDAGQLARNTILADFELLYQYGAAPTLNIIKQYDRDADENIFPTDVYSFHIDRSPIPVDTFLCTYYGATTEILPNAQSIQKILIPEIRQQLKNNFAGSDAAFETYLTEQFYDLHFAALPNAQIVQIPLGHICRLAVDHPNSQTLPCIHRAPLENPGEYRLLLIC
ncbi:MAG TPA: hypothetical protein PLJ00_17020 [Chitinophagales bacterium]|nr:hypothetical protein [Chitinophagales bacterium]